MTEVKNEITKGNLLSVVFTLGSAAILIAVAWGALNNSLGAMAKGFDDHESRLRVLEFQITGELAKINAKLGTIEKAVK